MPRIGKIEGLWVYIQDERTAKHNLPHFHVRGGGVIASITIDDPEVLAGELPNSKRRAVLEWARRYQPELRANYDLVQRGELPNWIED